MVTTDDELYTEDTEIPKAMEEVKSDRHPQTRKILYITKELQTNLTVVSHIQVVRTYDPKPTEPTDRNYDYRSASWFQTRKVYNRTLLNLTQHIEYGYERGVVIGTVFVDLSAAYDTISHKLLLNKIYRMTSDFKFTDLIGNMISNRRYFVELNGQKSRWRNQKNGLPQGSVTFTFTQMTNPYTMTLGVSSTQTTCVLRHRMHHLRRPNQPSAQH